MAARLSSTLRRNSCIASRYRHEQLQSLQLAVTRVLFEAESIEVAGPKVLEIIGQHLNWDVGILWSRCPQDHSLSLTAAWQRESDELHSFLEKSSSVTFAQGEDLPGHVWETASPTWVVHLSAGMSTHRAQIADRAGLHSALAFPILSVSESVGVMEFFSRGFRLQDEGLLSILSDLGMRLGLFIQRRRTEEELRLLYCQLEDKANTRAKELADKNAALNREITNHYITQADLETREIQLSLITDSLPVAVIYLDKKFNLQFVNSTYAKWRGTSKKQLIGLPIAELVGERSFALMLPHLQSAVEGQTTSYDISISYVDKHRILHVTYVPDFDANSHVRGIISVIIDMTDQKSIEKELRRARDDAEAASRAKSAFLANMSHEIRTPLGAVLGFSELILNKDISEAEQGVCVAAIKRNGVLLSNIISDILDLSKVEANRLTVDRSIMSMPNLLADLTAMLSLQAQDKGVDLSFQTKDDLPKEIVTDPLRLRQILINVISNAIKFTDNGTVKVQIQRSNESKDTSSNKLSFIVSDTGRGIPPEFQTRIFEPFTQADPSSTRRFGGSGLGLPLARRLARLLGGDVQLISSHVSKGSMFEINIDIGKVDDIPLNKSPDFTPPRVLDPTSSSLRTATPCRLQGLKILLVEDAPDNQMLISRLLRLAGASVEVADDGREGVEKSVNGNFDAILMDLQMPIMDGYEATKELRKRQTKTPIIALTAHALQEDRQRCLDNGFNDHVIKPVDQQRLIDTLLIQCSQIGSAYHTSPQ